MDGGEMGRDKPVETTVLYDVQDPEFYFSASLRISGEALDLDGITRRLGLQPSHQHRKGDRRGPRSPQCEADLWIYTSPVEETEHLTAHLQVLWEVLRPHKEYLKRLKDDFCVDLFCGFRTTCQVTGIEVDYKCLEMFAELEVPFGLSITVLE